MPQDTPSRHLDQFLVRFPDGLRSRIAEAAKANGRSMNSEIVHRLERSFFGAAIDDMSPALREQALSLLRALLEGTDARS